VSTLPISAPPTAEQPAADLTGQLTLVQSELTRADAKASTLLALTGLATTATVTVLTGRAHLPTTALALGWTATGLLAAAMLLLTRAIRPDLRGDYGFMAWARIDPGRLAARLRSDAAVERLSGGDVYRLALLSRLARTKFRLIRGGVDLLAAAVTVLVIAAATGAVTR
jgi:hypothetical protein